MLPDNLEAYLSGVHRDNEGIHTAIYTIRVKSPMDFHLYPIEEVERWAISKRAADYGTVKLRTTASIKYDYSYHEIEIRIKEIHYD